MPTGQTQQKGCRQVGKVISQHLVPTFSFWIFPAREEWVPTCWKSEGLKRILRFAFCLSQCF